MATQKFDELNRVETAEQYFNVVDGLTKIEKNERIRMAEELKYAISDFFDLVEMYLIVEWTDEDSLAKQLKEKYIDIASKYIVVDTEVESYIDKTCKDITRVTLAHKEKEYYLSQDRATLTANEETHTVFEYDEYKQAITSGKTKKMWVSERDNRVRETHAEVNGDTVGIREAFIVGGYAMLYPRDINAPLKERAGCRCHAKYY